LDEVSGYSGWGVAFSHDGSISLCRLADVYMPASSNEDRPRYDVEKLGRLIQALRNNELYVAAIDDRTRDEVRAPKGFWRGEWRYYRDRQLEARSIRGRPSGLVYLDPRLMVSQAGAPERLAWKFTKEILSGREAPRGHGRLIALARQVQPRLKAAGHNLTDDTIASYIRKSLKEWEEKHPGR
jgi:hypothetical protein